MWNQFHFQYIKILLCKQYVCKQYAASGYVEKQTAIKTGTWMFNKSKISVNYLLFIIGTACFKNKQTLMIT